MKHTDTENSQGLVSGVYDKGKAEQEPLPELKDSSALRKWIRGAADEIILHKNERKAINEHITAIYTEAESKGINRKAFKRAISLYELDQTDRDQQAFAFEVCSEALGIATQGELPLDGTKH